jgi:hypothetical protein
MNTRGKTTAELYDALGGPDRPKLTESDGEKLLTQTKDGIKGALNTLNRTRKDLTREELLGLFTEWYRNLESIASIEPEEDCRDYNED